MKTAHRLFDKALQIDPDYVLAIVGKGRTFNNEFKPDSALIYADRAIALAPEFNGGYGVKGYCYELTGKSDLALEHFFKAISLPPKDDWWYWYHVAIGQHYRNVEGDVIKALPYLKKGVQMKGSLYLPFAYGILIGAYYDIGDYEKVEEYQGNFNKLEEGCWALMRSTRLRNTQGKLQEALQIIDSTCQGIECDRICSLARFEAFVLSGEFERAEQQYKQYRDDRRDWDGLEIALVYYKLGKTEEAERIFTEEIEKGQSRLGKVKVRRWRAGIHYKLARIYAFTGKRNEALKYLAECAKIGFHGGDHDYILVDPFFESLRDDPEFQAIVKEAQEEKAALRAKVREMEERGELDL